MKIRPVQAELFHTDGHTDRHDEANSPFLQFANAPTTAGSTWTDHKTKTETANELIITTVLDKIQEYKNWFQHANGMPLNRLPRILRNQGRPLKRLLDA